MEEHETFLTEEEELELAELEKNKQSGLKYLLMIGIAAVSLILLYGLLILYPFNFKIQKNWADTQGGNYTIENKGKESVFRINELNGNANISLVFKGDLYSAGSNRYKTKNNKVYLEILKEGLEADAIESLKEEDAYTVSNETDELLLLEYTKATVEAAFPDNELNDLFYYQLKPDFLFRNKGEIKLRNSNFADPAITFAPRS